MASLNPARAMKLDKTIGQIKKGRRADLIIWHKESFKVKHVIANGITVF
jgi:N-acetylglucosamine-6-phosphate deacetylase